ncbi:MAG: sugar-binding transcriptional regulator [Anaerolineae bacterium]
MRERGERERLLVQTATLYYEQGLTQEEIAQRVGLSRSNVSRLLTEARRQGIVEIRIHAPLHTVPPLEEELRARFHLAEAYVMSSSGARSPDTVLQGLGTLAAEQVKRRLHHDMILGIGWGRALYETVNAFRRGPEYCVQVVQMMGGVGAVNPQIDGTELARRLAEALGGNFRYLHAPFLVESAATCRALKQERNVREVLELARQADLALAGIGAIQPELSGLVRAGYLTRDELLAAAQAGAVGDFYGHYLDIEGRVCQLELHERIIGIDLPSLRRIKCVLAVAGWKEKAPAILGVLRSGLVHILVTDDAAAHEVLRLADIT